MQANTPEPLADGTADSDGEGETEVDGEVERDGDAATQQTCIRWLWCAKHCENEASGARHTTTQTNITSLSFLCSLASGMHPQRHAFDVFFLGGVEGNSYDNERTNVRPLYEPGRF